jgi:aryl-alcohol dehydrogenase
MRTRAAVVRAPEGPFELRDVELPEPGPHEVVVRIVGVGICATDLGARAGALGETFPKVLGHEGAGVVDRVGSAVTKVAPGDHVVLAPDSDGTCHYCRMAQPMYCERGAELNFQVDPNGPKAEVTGGGKAFLKFFGQSSFAHHALASERNAVLVPKGVPLRMLGPLGCGVQTGAGTVINGLRARPGSTMVVLGPGAVGLAAIMAAVVSGCTDIIAVGLSAASLDVARSLGATDVIDTTQEPDLAKAIRARLPRGADFIVDAAGVSSLTEASMGGVANLGTLALVAVAPGRKLTIPWWDPTVTRGVSIRGFLEGNSNPDIFIPQLVDLYRQGRFPLDKMTRFYPFEKIEEAIADHHAGKAIKAILEPQA